MTDYYQNHQHQNFPGGPVVNTLPSNTMGVGSIPGQGTKILHVSWLKKKTQNIFKKQFCKTNSINTFKWFTSKKSEKKTENQHHHEHH